MSAFLGKIHYWLYNKILLQEKLLEEIATAVEKKNKDISAIFNESESTFGKAVKGELEEIIEHQNIHGWLSECIRSVEGRLAFTVTSLMKRELICKEELIDLFYEDAKKRGDAQLQRMSTAEACFDLIFDYMLEGMPCDRVNQIISSTEDEISWQTTRDIHKEFWDCVGGDIAIYHEIRTAWINGLLYAGGFSYQRNDNGLNVIRRVKA